MAYREKLEDMLNRLADTGLAEKGRLAFRHSDKNALISLKADLVHNKGWITDAEITGLHSEAAGHSFYLLEIAKTDLPCFEKQGITAARTALAYRAQHSEVPISISSAAEAMHVMNNILVWENTGSSLAARLDYQSPINLQDVVKYFSISGLYNITHDDRTQQRVLSLYPQALKELKTHGFKHTDLFENQPKTTIIERSKEVKEAIDFLNARTSEGKFHFTWINGLHLPRTPSRQGMQSLFTFTDKAAAENFCTDYLNPAGAQNPIVEKATKQGKDPVTGVYGVIQTSSEWHIFLLKEDILRLKANGLDEGRRWANQYGIG